MHILFLLPGVHASTHSGHQCVFLCSFICAFQPTCMDIRLQCEFLRPFREKEKHHRDGVGAHLQTGNPLSTGVAQDMRMLEEGKIHINRWLHWNSYHLLESPVSVLEPLQVTACNVSKGSPVESVKSSIRLDFYTFPLVTSREFEEKPDRPVVLAQDMAVIFPVLPK